MVKNTFEDKAAATDIAFPRLIRIDEQTPGNSQTFRHVQTSMEYDSFGNITRKCVEGSIANGGAIEGFEGRCDYTEYETYDTQLWLLSRPRTVRTRSDWYPQQDLSRTTFSYEAGSNRVSSKTFWLKDKVAGQSDPAISYGYDEYGNLEEQQDANGNTSARIVYDEATKTFPVIAINAKDQQSSTTYDHVSGKPSSKTDINGNETTYTYDVFGRPETVIVTGYTTGPPTVSYEYGADEGGFRKITTKSRKDSGSEAVYTVTTYLDGFGREIRTESDGPATPKIVTHTKYDTSGKVWKKSLPYFEGAQDTPEVENLYDG
ncbi:MAG: DUF6443 domain-containing protein, partial [Syntrophobacteraceae bacterium]